MENSQANKQYNTVGSGVVWSLIVTIGPVRFGMIPNGPLWSLIVSYCPKWSHMVLNGFIWCRIVQYGLVWSHMVPLVLFGTIRYSKILYGPV